MLHSLEVRADEFAESARRAGCEVAVVGRASLAHHIERWAGAGLSETVGLSEEVRRSLPELAPLDHRGDSWPHAAVGLGMLGVAETGTVAVAESSHADRLMALLCVRHMLLLPVTSLVPSLHDAAPLFRTWLGRGVGRYLTLVSGASRTSDIERVLTIGVHGPRELAIVLVEGWDRAHD